MSLLPHTFFPRSMYDMNEWSKKHFTQQLKNPLSTVDLFDPFDELDHMIGRNLQWLNKPDFIQSLPLVPKVPHKYRISIDCHGYSPESIKTEIKDKNKLVVTGCEEGKPNELGDYSKKEFKKTYILPPNAESDKLVCFMAGGHKLIIEVPLITSSNLNADMLPNIIDNKDGSKSVAMKFTLPENIVDPTKVHVSVKDRDLIVRAEDKVEKKDGYSEIHYYMRTTLPENTEFDNLKCVYDKNMITATAPLNLDWKRCHRQIPVEHKVAIDKC